MLRHTHSRGVRCRAEHGLERHKQPTRRPLYSAIKPGENFLTRLNGIGLWTKTEAKGHQQPELCAVHLSIAAGQWRWRWDLNPRMSCPITRFRGVRPRPLGDSTAAEPT